jgi:hypothetical protein
LVVANPGRKYIPMYVGLGEKIDHIIEIYQDLYKKYIFPKEIKKGQ